MKGLSYLLLLSVIPMILFGYQGVEASGPISFQIDSIDGGDCSAIGVWNQGTLTCTLNQDIFMNYLEVLSSDITIDGNGKSLNGAGQGYCDYDWYNGIEIDFVTGVTIKDLSVNGYHHGIDIDNGGSHIITNVNSSNNCDDNIILRDSHNSKFTNVVADNSLSDDGVDLEGSDNNEFNTLFTHDNDDNGVDLDSSDNNKFTNLSVLLNGGDGVKLEESDGNSFEKITISSNGDEGVDFEDDSEGNTFANGIVNDNDSSGVELDESHGNTFSDLTISDNRGHGIRLGSSEGGESESASNNNVFLRNTISGNGHGGDNEEGIQINYSHDNRFALNTISDNKEEGFDIERNSFDNIIECNTLSENRRGVELEDAGEGNVVTGNTFSANFDVGYLNDDSGKTSVFLNNFINQADSIRDESEGSDNIFDNYFENSEVFGSEVNNKVQCDDDGHVVQEEITPILLGSDNENNIFEIDTNTGAANLVGTLSMMMDDEPYFEIPYGTEIECTPGTNDPQCYFQSVNGFFTIQQFDYPSIARVGDEVYDGAAFNGLEYVNGQLYGISITGPCGPSELSILNPDTGVSQFIGLTGVGPISGLAFDETNQIMYGVSGCGGGGGEGPGDINVLNQHNPNSSKLYTINLQTGNAMLVADTGISNLGGLQFGPDGKLYGAGNNRDGGNLYIIDKNSGAATLVGPTGFSGVTGLTLILGAPVPPTPLPSQGDNGGMNHWDTRPTFGISHETRQDQIVENGFSFNGEYFTVTDNHHTDFAEQSVEIGIQNTFSATVYADKKLKVQEFLFGIPNVGEAHLAELGVEVWYDLDGNIEDIIVAQETSVIDEGTISVSHEKTKCLSTDPEPLCDTTTVSMTFNEPLKDKVMAIKAIDHERRDQRTFLNEGFDISGESLNPMFTQMIPSNVKNQGLVQVTQVAKYSPYWQSEDGRMFEMNSFGSFKEVNQTFERFQDSGNAFTRMHSGFGGIINYEQNRATQVFDSTKLISELPNSFGYHFEMKQRFNEQLLNEMTHQQEIAKEILKEMDKQNRYY